MLEVSWRLYPATELFTCLWFAMHTISLKHLDLVLLPQYVLSKHFIRPRKKHNGIHVSSDNCVLWGGGPNGDSECNRARIGKLSKINGEWSFWVWKDVDRSYFTEPLLPSTRKPVSTRVQVSEAPDYCMWTHPILWDIWSGPQCGEHAVYPSDEELRNSVDWPQGQDEWICPWYAKNHAWTQYNEM